MGGETESQIRAAPEQAIQQSIMQQKYYKQKELMKTVSTVA